jgi:hypothetical protein
MARITVRERAPVPSPSSTKVALFRVMCTLADVVSDLQTDVDEPHAEVLLQAYDLGWRPKD